LTFIIDVRSAAGLVDLLSADFSKDIWNGKNFEECRKALALKNGECPVFEL
jgi:hypothetical protein